MTLMTLVVTLAVSAGGCGSIEVVETGTSTTELGVASCTTTSVATETSSTATSNTATSEPTTSSQSTTTTTPTSVTSTPSDPMLLAQQQSLVDLGYWLGEVDGVLGSRTTHAVTAFQKVEGLPRSGQLDEQTLERLSTATTPLARSSVGTVLEVDLTHQVLLEVVDGQVEWIYDIATGAATTPTPSGEYEIYHEIDGYRHAPLGTLYRPKYFNGGIALHGFTSVPSEPASHGCVRLTYSAMDHLWASGSAPIGTPVWVY